MVKDGRNKELRTQNIHLKTQKKLQHTPDIFLPVDVRYEVMLKLILHIVKLQISLQLHQCFAVKVRIMMWKIIRGLIIQIWI